MVNRTQRIALVVGPLSALLVAASTSTIRDDVGSTAVGVALALLVTCAALLGRAPGLATAIVASLSYNYFHTEPVHTFRIHESGDLAIVLLLAVLGLLVGDVMSWRERRLATADARERSARAGREIEDLTERFVPVADAWATGVTALLDEMRLVECRLVHDDPTGIPHISRHARPNDPADDEFVLPQTGAAFSMPNGRGHLGSLVLVPRPGQGAVRIRRSSVIALADDLALAAARAGS